MTNAVNYNDILSAYSAYAPAIRPYLLYADTLEEIRSKLTKTTRLVFLDLVARTNIADPKKPIMVRVDRTAEKLGISEKSVSRTICLMRKNGWLDASQQHDGRNNNGEFAWREYVVTPALRALLRMPQTARESVSSTPPYPLPSSTSEASPVVAPKQAVGDAEVDVLPSSTRQAVQKPSGQFDRVHKALEIVMRRANQQTKLSKQAAPCASLSTNETDAPADNSVQIDENTPAETDLSAGPIYAVNNVFLKKEASLQSEAIKKEASFKNPSEKQTQKAPKTVRIPADLVEMKELLDILPEGICSLMALAKRTGQRLQDVWKAKREVLLNSGAKNGRAVNYIRFLLNCGEDFSYIARTKISPQCPTPAPQAQSSTVHNSAAEPGPSASANAAPKAQGATGKVIGLDLLKIADACRYKRFQHVSKGIRVRVFDGTAEIIAGAKTALLAGWDQMQYLYRDIALGELVEVAQ